MAADSLPSAGRRRLLRATGCATAAALGPAWAFSQVRAPLRVVCLDWTIAETALSLGLPLAGLADRRAYADWVGEPAVPASTRDVGLRVQPSREVLAQIRPDLILSSSLLASVTPLVAAIAPVRLLDFYGAADPDRTPPWTRFSARTRDVARLLLQPQAATRWLQTANAWMDQAARHPAVVRQRQQPVLVLQCVDARSVRVYGDSSVFGAALARLGLPNAWQAPVSMWGSDTVTLERLLGVVPDTRALVIPPLPRDLSRQLTANPLWQNLPFVRRRQVATLPRVWSFGALPSALRFAGLLIQALDGRLPGGWSDAPTQPSGAPA